MPGAERTIEVVSLGTPRETAHLENLGIGGMIIFNGR